MLYFSQSEILLDSLRQQTINYFRHFHHGRLDELRIFLEHESWEACPVLKNFSVLNLVEFQFLKKPANNFLKNWPANSTNIASSDEEFYCNSNLQNSPFEKFRQDTIETRKISSSESSVNLQNASDEFEMDGESGADGPFLANTTLSLLRMFGRYLNFMKLFKTIAFDVLICLNQLFDFYVWSVYNFFGTYPPTACAMSLTPKLQVVIARIEEMLILSPNSDQTGETKKTTSFVTNYKVNEPQISSVLQLDHPNQLYGLRLRLIAAESVGKFMF